jgi:hypothetical protein
MYTYHLFSFLLCNLPGLPILCAAKMDSFLFVTGTERTVFTIYQKNFTFLLSRRKSINITTKRKLFHISKPHLNRWGAPPSLLNTISFVQINAVVPLLLFSAVK